MLLDSAFRFLLLCPSHSGHFFNECFFFCGGRIISDTKLLANIEKQVCVRNIFLRRH